MITLINLQKDIVERERKYFQNPEKYLKVLKKLLESKLGKDIKIYLFGSVCKQEFIIGKSDIDVLVVSDNIPNSVRERSKLKTEFLKEIHDLYAPFEIHFATIQDFKVYYRDIKKEEIL